MSRVLAVPAVAVVPRSLSGGVPAVDPFSEALAAAAYARGVREGAAAGRAGAIEECRAVVAGLQLALDRAAAEVRALRDDGADATVELAAAIAEVVVGARPDDEAVGLLRRVRDALDRLDDEPLVVSANPADVDAVSAGLADLAGVAIAADPTLARGDARVAGPWANADVSRAAAWAAVREALGV